MDIQELGKGWKRLACTDANKITGTSAIEIIPAPASNLAIIVSDLRIWNEHASASTTVEIYSGANLIDAGPAGFDYRGFNTDRKVPLRCNKGEALNLKPLVASQIKWSVTYKTTPAPLGNEV